MDVDLAIKLSKLVHDECKEVPHNIGITLTRIIEKHQKQLTLTDVSQQRELHLLQSIKNIVMANSWYEIQVL